MNVLIIEEVKEWKSPYPCLHLPSFFFFSSWEEFCFRNLKLKSTFTTIMIFFVAVSIKPCFLHLILPLRCLVLSSLMTSFAFVFFSSSFHPWDRNTHCSAAFCERLMYGNLCLGHKVYLPHLLTLKKSCWKNQNSMRKKMKNAWPKHNEIRIC